MSSSRTFEEITENLMQGPRMKGAATYDLEAIVCGFLDDSKQVECNINALNELEVTIDDQRYNLTHIFRHADFEHLSFDEKTIDRYAKFVNSGATFKPILSTKTPTPEDYTSPHHNHLYYGEKLAITLYTGDYYDVINRFLRGEGIIETFEMMKKKELTNTVKELITGICIASHGLCKMSDTLPSDKNATPERPNRTYCKTEEEYREKIKSYQDEIYQKGIKEKIKKETLTRMEYSDYMKEILESRIQGIQTNRIQEDTQKAFTSTRLENDKLPLTDQNVITTIEQPKGPSKIAVSIEALSKHKEEKEALMPPKTQLIYHHVDKKDDITYLNAVVVRTPNGCDPFAYSHNDMTIRGHLLDYRAQLNSVHNKTIINCIDSIILSIGQNGHVTLDAIKNLYPLHDELQKFHSDFFKQLAVCANTLILQKAIDQHGKLINHAFYVYKKYLSKAYKDTPEYLEINGIKIHRPNHGLAHVMRCAIYIEHIVRYFKHHAKNNEFSDFCSKLNKDDIEKLQLAVLFIITGRESEISRHDDPEKYMSYRESSVKYFRAYAEQMHMSESDMDKYIDVNYHDYLGEQSKGKDYPEKQFIAYIVTLAHTLDLMRCYDIKEFEKCINKVVNNDSVIDSDDQKAELTNLYRLASECIRATGDMQLICTDKDGTLASTFKKHDDALFFRSSLSAPDCLTLCFKPSILLTWGDIDDDMPKQMKALIKQYGRKIMCCSADMWALIADHVQLGNHLVNETIDSYDKKKANCFEFYLLKYLHDAKRIEEIKKLSDDERFKKQLEDLNGKNLFLLLGFLPEEAQSDLIKHHKMLKVYLYKQLTIQPVTKNKVIKSIYDMAAEQLKDNDPSHLISILTGIPEEVRFYYFIKMEDLIKTAWFAYVVKLLPKDKQLEFVKRNTVFLYNLNVAIALFVSLSPNDQLQLVQHLAETDKLLLSILTKHGLFDVTNRSDKPYNDNDIYFENHEKFLKFLKISSETDLFSYKKIYQNQIYNADQLTSVLKVLPFIHRLGVAIKLKEIIQNYDEFKLILDSLSLDNNNSDDMKTIISLMPSHGKNIAILKDYLEESKMNRQDKIFFCIEYWKVMHKKPCKTSMTGLLLFCKDTSQENKMKIAAINTLTSSLHFKSISLGSDTKTILKNDPILKCALDIFNRTEKKEPKTSIDHATHLC